MVLSHLLLVAGIAVLSIGLRTLDSAIAQNLSVAGILATSFLGGYFLTGSTLAGALCASSWLLLPWLELLTRIRKLRLPLEKNLRHKSPPSREIFPALGDLTDEIEEEEFEHVDDAGWDWEDYQQFFRLFYKPSEKMQSAICMVDQDSVAFYYLSISSRAKDGTVWTTWNYPFSYSLKLVPHWRMNRLRGDRTFLQMHESHREWLRRNRITADQLEDIEPEKMHLEIQKDLRAQIAHNLAKGVLKQTDEGHIRYSWRGLIFIWVQFLRDLVRL